MEYSEPFYLQHERVMHNPTPTLPAPHPMLHQEGYSNGSGMPSGIHGPVYPGSPQDEAEELDTSSRPRLTQEQIAILEKHFKGKNKPNTDFKRQLAKQIGLSLQRVNVSAVRHPYYALTDKRCRTGIKTAAPRPGIKADRSKALMLCLHNILPSGRPRTCRSQISLIPPGTGFPILVPFLRLLRRLISYRIPDPTASLRRRHSRVPVRTRSNPYWTLPISQMAMEAWRTASNFPRNRPPYTSKDLLLPCLCQYCKTGTSINGLLSRR